MLVRLEHCEFDLCRSLRRELTAASTFQTNRLGYKWALVLGTVGYAPYAAGLYENKLHGTVWLVLFGSVCCGLSAGLFWGVEGAIIMGCEWDSFRSC